MRCGGGVPQTVIAVKAAQIIAVFSIPLCPAIPSRERTDLIHAADIPRLCNQLHAAENGVECQTFQQRRFGKRTAVLIASENARKIKAKTVTRYSTTQYRRQSRIKLPYHRLIAVERIADAGEIIVFAVRVGM